MDIKRLKDENYDFKFICDTQPMGNLRFLDNMIQTGNAFMTSLYVWRYPSEPEGFWQSYLHSIENSFVITDIANQESTEVLKKLQNAIREQYTRISEEKQAYDREIAHEEYSELNRLAKSIRKSQEVMKYMSTRIILYADTRLELEKRVADIRKQLEKEQFGVAMLAMEQEYEYQAMFIDYISQLSLPNKRTGFDVPTEQIRMTFPANHVFMNDDRGQHLGYSLTNGNIIVDFFELDGIHRKHYNIIVVGEMGSGKSTFIKKVMRNLFARGYLLRGFDKSGEYSDLIHHLGGKLIALDGTQGQLNIFQVFPTVIDSTTNQINEEASFTQHKSKLGTWYSIIKPTASHEEIDFFELSLNGLYEKFGFNVHDKRSNITNRLNTEYPRLANLIEYIQDIRENQNLTPFEQEHYERIHTTLRKLQEKYSAIFDGYTSFDNLQEEQVLFFNIDGLMQLEDKAMTDAQMFNALTLFWATLINNGKEQARRYKKRKVAFDEIIRSMLIIDECHNQINKDNPRQTKFVNTMQREGRKYFVGVLLATQSISSLAPENMTDHEAELLRDIYNFSQYKIFFKLSSANIPHLQRLAEYDITDGQVERIARYPQGRCLMNVTGGASIEFDVDVSDRELELYNGGGRNVDDM